MRIIQKVSVVGVVGVVLASCGVAWAQSDSADFPRYAVRMDMNHGNAGSSGTMAKIMKEQLEAELGQRVIVTYGSGGDLRGNNATRASAPDGHTITLATTASLFSNSRPAADKAYGVDRMQDLVAVTNLAETPSVLVIRTELGVSTFEEFVALAKEWPGELTYKLGGGIHSLEMTAIQGAAGIELKGIEVPNSSLAPGGNSQTGPIVQDRVDVLITTGGYMLPHIESGKIKALALMFPRRLDAFPGVPTAAEVGVPGLMGNWMGIFASPGTPPEIAEALHAAIKDAAEHPDVMAAAGAQSFNVAISASPAAFQTYTDEDVARLGAHIAELGWTRD